MGRGRGSQTQVATVGTRGGREDWLQRARKGVADLGLNSYEVGGSLRDEQLGRTPKDLDICVVGSELDQLLARLDQAGKADRLDVAGKTIGARLYASWAPKGGIEFALARKEVSTGQGHKDFAIEAAPDVSLEQDLERRDFTCNALAREILPDGSPGKLVDLHGGAEDIKNGVLRAVGPTTIAEDPLRVLRGLARMAKDGSHPDQQTLRAMQAEISKLGPDGPLSSERIFEETQKLLSGRYAADALRLARDAGIFQEAFPELAPMSGFSQESQYHDLGVDDHSFQALQRACEWDAPLSVRWAALLHDSGKPLVAFRGKDGFLHYYADPDDPEAVSHEEKGAEISSQLLGRLKAPRDLEEKVELLVREHMYGQDRAMNKRSARKNAYKARKMIQTIGRDNIEELMLLRRCDAAGKKADLQPGWDDDFIAFETLVRQQMDAPLTTKELAINGHDLLKLGLKGKEIGTVQRELLQRVVEDPEANNPDRLNSWAETLAAKELRRR